MPRLSSLVRKVVCQEEFSAIKASVTHQNICCGVLTKEANICQEKSGVFLAFPEELAVDSRNLLCKIDVLILVESCYL